MRSVRWVGVKELSDETGLSVRALQYIVAREPGVLTTRNGKRGVEFEQPTCAVALRKREVDKAAERAKPADAKEAERRLAVAQAEMAELKLAEMRRELMTTADGERLLADAYARVDAKLKYLPQRIAGMAWSADLTEKLRQADGLVDEVRAELAEGADVPDEVAA